MKTNISHIKTNYKEQNNRFMYLHFNGRLLDTNYLLKHNTYYYY